MPKIRSLLKNAEKCSIYIFRKARKKTRNPKVKNPTRPKTRKGLARTARNPKISGPSHHYRIGWNYYTYFLGRLCRMMNKETGQCTLKWNPACPSTTYQQQRGGVPFAWWEKLPIIDRHQSIWHLRVEPDELMPSRNLWRDIELAWKIATNIIKTFDLIVIFL